MASNVSVQFKKRSPALVGAKAFAYYPLQSGGNMIVTEFSVVQALHPLFASQSDHRINSRSAPSGQPAG